MQIEDHMTPEELKDLLAARYSDKQAVDLINYPPHYTAHPSGIECIQITEHMGYNLGNAMKYIWRADLKEDAIKDLRKAEWYIQREIKKRMRDEKEPS